jgi:hypothetical protein
VTLLLPGASLQVALRTLSDVGQAASDMISGTAGQTPSRMLDDYLRWTETAERALRQLVGPLALAELVFTRRYELIRGLDVLSPRLIPLLLAELEGRAEALQATIGDLTQAQERWGGLTGDVLVPDTNLLLHHPQELPTMDWWRFARDGGPEMAVHVVLPLVVIDELDRLKRAGREDVKRRARTTLRAIERLFGGDPARRVALGDRSAGARQGDATLDLFLDPPSHRRHASADAEIVLRALDLGQLIGKAVHLVSYDLGMRLRATAAGLRAVEPTEAESSGKTVGQTR